MDWKTYKLWLNSLLLSEVPKDSRCPSFDQLVTDSRAIRPGDWFIPLKGENFDGHSFIAQAIAQGASGFFTERDFEFPVKVPYLRVSNTMQAYHALASGWRQSFPASCKIVALTGSVGKTTVKTMLNLMLSHIAKTFCTPGNQNTDFSIPKALLQMTPDYNYGVFEFGARRPGDISFLTETVRPDVAVCLNVASAHLGMFGSRDVTMKTKLEIIGHSPSDCIGVCLYDDSQLLQQAQKLSHKLITFGHDTNADVAILSIQHLASGTEIRYKIFDKSINVLLPVFHESYPINMAAALAVGQALNLDAQKCADGLKEFAGLKGRYQIFKMKSGLTVIDDAYNASPESMKAGLSSLKQNFPTLRKALILGDMRELGSITEEAHRNIGKLCSTLEPTLLLTVGEHSQWIAEEAVRSGLNSENVLRFNNADQVLKNLPRLYKDTDVIYVKGSFAIQLNRVVEQIISENS